MTGVVESLANIEMMLGDGYKFLKLRFSFEKWEKEAKEGNIDSQKLVDMVYQFERLVKIASNDLEKKEKV